ncbi:exostosin-like glycosyltransferase [Micractinium conductrix]|uniref:Exostosin-like glycosyltransferase n=1 Tax=Micractinium conductrix TaxID=554055 RepID=A0A2P6VFQ6_9CHLO|nr:exostosin-like glycosyltransferase [Micractinium conductrix]|eukprot:PSC72923.1 exostosin-like glycosyltransferase [Micractinium conductrix]
MKRHCAHTYTDNGFERHPQPANLSLGVKERESIWAFPSSRCAGFCDDTIAACFCPSNTTYGRIPAPPHARLDAPPERRGRPMGYLCQPDKMPDGQHTNWGTVDPEELWGPAGWCMAEQPKLECHCMLDGFGGPVCETPYEPFCLNQCSGRGECNLGFCKCHEGWHGIDCAQPSQAVDTSVPGLEAARPWIRDFVHTPAAREFPAGATRKRPLIYVYELPSEYTTLMLQYRLFAEYCTPRIFNPDNTSYFTTFTYGAETGFLEALLQSEHRTLDPEEADFFYVPVFTACFMSPVRDVADSLFDFWYNVAFNRAQGAANMLLEAYHWIRGHLPYWDRRGGRDHIWLVTHDEASCYVPAAIRPSIILSHWGRTDLNHTSDTGYPADNYLWEAEHPQFEPRGWRRKVEGFPCFNRTKDLVIPSFKPPEHWRASPLLGALTRERSWLGFHRGRVQPENKAFSRGIRQRLEQLAVDQGWKEKHRIVVGERDKVEGPYSELLASSVFCLVIMGDGWTARMEDAMLHGCIPVVIMDDVEVAFETVLDLSDVMLRVPQSDLEQLPAILSGVPEERREEMRARLARVWHRYSYSSYPPYAKQLRELQEGHAAARDAPPLSQPATVPGLDPRQDDAFETVMAWLYSRIDATR